MQQLRHWLGIYARGIAIGAADLVPGVSGGTIAFITGIYTRLLAAINIGSSPITYALLIRGQVKIFWKAVDGTFIAILLLGVATAIFTLTATIRDLLINETIALLSFFVGLTLAAAVEIARRLPAWTLRLGLLCLAGLAVTLALTLSSSVSLQQAPPLQGFFAAGMLALCAMILPGISGSFILLLLGVYPFLIEAVHQRSWSVIATFMAGGILGLILFARLLRLLLVRRHDATIAVLVGIMLGALPKLWPWKEPLADVTIILQPSIWPSDVTEPEYLTAAIALACGVLCVVITEQLTRRMNQT